MPARLRASRVLPGVAAVIFDAEGRVLLVRRADNGHWGLPSGKVEVGESVADAVVREVQEETGLRVRVARLIGVYSDPASQTFVYPDGEAVQFVTCSFLCQPEGGQLRARPPEILAAASFPPTSLPRPLLPMHPLWLHDAVAGGHGLIR